LYEKNRKRPSILGKVIVAKPKSYQGGLGLLKNIILQTCQQFITEVLDFFKEGKTVSLVEMEKGLKRSSDKFLRKIINTYLEEIDHQIAEDKAGRKQKGLLVELINEERTVYTRFGALIYFRLYYFDKRKKRS